MSDEDENYTSTSCDPCPVCGRYCYVACFLTQADDFRIDSLDCYPRFGRFRYRDEPLLIEAGEGPANVVDFCTHCGTGLMSAASTGK